MDSATRDVGRIRSARTAVAGDSGGLSDCPSPAPSAEQEGVTPATHALPLRAPRGPGASCHPHARGARHRQGAGGLGTTSTGARCRIRGRPPSAARRVGAASFEVTRERIRQIEAKALRKLRHPSQQAAQELHRELSSLTERRQTAWATAPFCFCQSAGRRARSRVGQRWPSSASDIRGQSVRLQGPLRPMLIDRLDELPPHELGASH